MWARPISTQVTEGIFHIPCPQATGDDTGWWPAFEGSAFSAVPGSTHISRNSVLVDRVLLCCNKRTTSSKWEFEPHQRGVSGTYSHPPLVGREVLTVICCPREGLYLLCALLGAVALLRYVRFLTPSRAGTKILGWNKSVTEGQTLHDSMCMRYLK